MECSVAPDNSEGAQVHHHPDGNAVRGILIATPVSLVMWLIILSPWLLSG